MAALKSHISWHHRDFEEVADTLRRRLLSSGRAARKITLPPMAAASQVIAQPLGPGCEPKARADRTIGVGGVGGPRPELKDPLPLFDISSIEDANRGRRVVRPPHSPPPTEPPVAVLPSHATARGPDPQLVPSPPAAPRRKLSLAPQSRRRVWLSGA